MRCKFALGFALMAALAVSAASAQQPAGGTSPTQVPQDRTAPDRTADGPPPAAPTQPAQLAPQAKPAPAAASTTTTVAPGMNPAEQNVVAEPPKTSDERDPLEQPPLPNKGKVALIGGTVEKIDRIRNRLKVRAFGGHKIDVVFDERTKIFRNDNPSTQLGINKGDRVYLDTMWYGSHIFAKNIQVQTDTQVAEARGQLTGYDAEKKRFLLRDQLSSQPMGFLVADDTVIRKENAAGTTSDLLAGALVNIKFSPDARRRGVAKEVNILAAPGSQFVFAGKVTNVDMSHGWLAVQNRADDKLYDVYFAADVIPNKETLLIGAEVAITAVFEGTRYTARTISIEKPAGAQ